MTSSGAQGGGVTGLEPRVGAPAPRCAVHPGRAAAGACPACGRRRCRADALAVPNGCLACGGRAADRRRGHRQAGPLERLVTGGLVAMGLGLLGGWIATQYIGAGAFALIVPFLVGLCCASGAAGAARTTRGRLDLAVRAVAAAMAVAGTALAYKLVPGSQSPWSPVHTVLAAYAAAVLGAAVSRILR